MDHARLFSMKLGTISSLLDLQTYDGQESDDGARIDFSVQFAQSLQEFSNAELSGNEYVESYKEGIRHLTQACINMPFVFSEYSRACHTLLECCLSLVISRLWMQVDTASQLSFSNSLMKAHQFLVPWVGHGFFLASGLVSEAWSHPMLHKILLGQDIPLEQVHAFLTYEGHYLCEQRIKILLDENYVTQALNLSRHCARNKVMGKNPIFLETLLMLQDDSGKADEMWIEIQWHHCSLKLLPVLSSFLNYAESTAAKVSTMLIVKEWQMETTSLEDMRLITETWVMSNWQDTKGVMEIFEQRVRDVIKATNDSLYIMYMADSLYEIVDNDEIIALGVELCLSGLCKQPTDSPLASYLATSTVDLNNAAICHVIAKMIKDDYALYRLCLLTAFCITPSEQSLEVLTEAYATTPFCSTAAHPSKLPSAIHCGTVKCLCELLPKVFNPKFTPANEWASGSWAPTRKLCERLLRCTKYVPSTWTLSNGKTVTVNTYVKHNMNPAESSDEKTAEETEESDVYMVEDSDSVSVDFKLDRLKVNKAKRLKTMHLREDINYKTKSMDDCDGADANTNESIKSKVNGERYNLRPSRQKICITLADDDDSGSPSVEEIEMSSCNDDDDDSDWAKKDSTSRGPSERSQNTGQMLENGSGIFPARVVKRTADGVVKNDSKIHDHDCNRNFKESKMKMPERTGKRGRPRKYPKMNDLLMSNATSAGVQVVNAGKNISSDKCITSAISTTASIVIASTQTVAKAIKPIQRVMESMTESSLRKQSCVPVTASNDYMVCEGHRPSEGKPFLLLKSKESNSNSVNASKSKARRKSVASSHSCQSATQNARCSHKDTPIVLSVSLQDITRAVPDKHVIQSIEVESGDVTVDGCTKQKTQISVNSSSLKPNFTVSTQPESLKENLITQTAKPFPAWTSSQSAATFAKPVTQPTSADSLSTESSLRHTDSMCHIQSSVAHYPTTTLTSTIQSMSMVPSQMHNVSISSHEPVRHIFSPKSASCTQKITPTSTKQSVPMMLSPLHNKPVTFKYNGKTFEFTMPASNVPLEMASCKQPVVNLQTLTVGNSNSQMENVPISQTLSSPDCDEQAVAVQTPVVQSRNCNVQMLVPSSSANSNPSVCQVLSTTCTVPSAIPNIQILQHNSEPAVKTITSATIPGNMQSVSSPANLRGSLRNRYILPCETNCQVVSGTLLPIGNPVKTASSIFTTKLVNTKSLTRSSLQHNAQYDISMLQGNNHGVPVSENSEQTTSQASTESEQILPIVPNSPTAMSSGCGETRESMHISQPMWLAYPPSRPMTRSQMQPTRPLTRSYTCASPRFSLQNAQQTVRKTKQTLVRGNGRGVGGQVLAKPYRTVLPNSNGQLTKQLRSGSRKYPCDISASKSKFSSSSVRNHRKT